MVSHDTIHVTKLIGYCQFHLGFGGLRTWSCSLTYEAPGRCTGISRLEGRYNLKCESILHLKLSVRHVPLVFG